MTKDRDVQRFRCEKIVKESWSIAKGFKDEIEEVLKKDRPRSSNDISLLIIAAAAFIQKVTLEDVENKELFECDHF